MIKDLKELPRLTDSVSYLYIEYARIEQDNFSIKIIQGDNEIPIPVTQFCVLFLGPGTSITHQAIKICASVGTLLVWCGENLNFYYASGLGETKSSKNLLKQVEYLGSQEKHLDIVRRMYKFRFPDINMSQMQLKEMRGLEGARVKSFYNQCSKLYNVPWNGREYVKENWRNSNQVNQAITYGNSLLYGLCHSVIIALGYSPSLGFIHTGNVLSFVFDIADLYKADFIIPIAFKVASMKPDDIMLPMRQMTHSIFGQKNLLQKIVKDLENLFGEINLDEDMGSLWDIGENIKFGKNYG